MKKLAGNLGGAIGSRYLKGHNRLVFTEYSGFISKVDLTASSAVIVSQGSKVITGTYTFDCETGALGTPGATTDIWWDQQTASHRQMVPQNGAKIVNLGVVDFASVTPATIGLFAYSSTPIPGNNDATNRLVVGDVFCVATNAGNFCKIKVTDYGYDLHIDWVTYKLNPTYARIGSGYTNPEDIAVLANENTAYVTERAGNLLRVDLSNADRIHAISIASGLTAPQQLWVDEVHNEAYIVEYSNSGRLVKVNLATHVVTPIYSGLNGAIGVIVTSDLASAYISEESTGSILKIDLTSRVKSTVATGISHPFFLSWADDNETALLVPDRLANKIVMVDISKNINNVNDFITGTAAKPSSVAFVNPGNYCVCSDTEVDQFYVGIPNGLVMGIGNVPFSMISLAGLAVTAPGYSWQFPQNSPFGGTLPVMIDQHFAFDSGVGYYQISVSTSGGPVQVRYDEWTDVRMDPATGLYSILAPMKPDANGLYQVQNPSLHYYHSQLGCLLDSTNLTNGLYTITINFFDAAKAPMLASVSHTIFIDNNSCIATLEMPNIAGHYADPDCGYLKYVNLTDVVTINYTASEPLGYGSYSFWVIRGAGNSLSPNPNVSGPIAPGTIINGHSSTQVGNMFGPLCNVKGIAAFGVGLYVYSGVINGVGRQSQYDASRYYAFCLAK